MNSPQPQPAPVVYLIEDDPTQQAALTAVLGQRGYRTVVFDSTERFVLYQPEERQPSCLLLDLF